MSGKFAINVYFDQLFSKMKSLKVVDVKNQHMKDAMAMCRLCMFMRSSIIKECRDIFVRDHDGETSPQVKQGIYKNILKYSGNRLKLMKMA